MIFYVIVALTAGQVQSEFITESYGRKCDYNKKIRVYSNLGQARAYRNKLRKENPSIKQGGADYKIARLVVWPDSQELTTDWIE